MAIENKNLLSPFKALKNLFKKPLTVRFPKEDLNVFPIPGVSPNYRGLHTNDLEKCIGCGTCADICPTDAIRMIEYPDLVPKEGELPRRPTIDYGRCCFCGYCVDVCTTGSLSMSRDYIHIVPTPKVKDPNKEVTLIKDSFIIKPTEEHGDNIGYFTPDEYSWLDLERVKMEGLHTEKRSDSFIEIVKGFSKEQAEKEASRCVECGVCTETCPAQMNIPEYIHAIWDHDLKESVREIYKTNPLPNVCGRVCTHKCETVCSLSHRGEAVAIRWLKRYAVDNLDYEDVKKVAAHGAIKAKNKKVSIIGAGPAGLSAAYYLSLMGYEITIYEKMSLAGG
ncbi:4Fe-4S binding protein, partial [bacterium]|nr:4Fe-4S binding protein [bacterium]